ncbi:MAG: hypothetical protein WD577_10120 [Bacteroidales bacterium]
MKWIFNIVFFIFGTLLFFSCTNHNEFDLFGEEVCDTTNITWEGTIADILQTNCVVCHGSVTSYNNVRHDSYEAVRVVVDDGRLRGVINHQSGFVPMPYERRQLPFCELLQINIWLDNGAPEN